MVRKTQFVSCKQWNQLPIHSDSMLNVPTFRMLQRFNDFKSDVLLGEARTFGMKKKINTDASSDTPPITQNGSPKPPIE